MSDGQESGGVIYTVKELLAGQNVALDRIERKLDAATDSTAQAIGKLDVRLALVESRPNLEPRVRLLENAETGRLVLSSWQRFFFGVLCVGLAGALSTIIWIALSA